MRISREKIADLLRFYVESGTTMAVGNTPTNHYAYNTPAASFSSAMKGGAPVSISPAPFPSPQSDLRKGESMTNNWLPYQPKILKK